VTMERPDWIALREGVSSSDRRVRGGAAIAAGALTGAVSSLYHQAIDRMLTTPERVTSAAEGKALLASDEGAEAMADLVQKATVLAVPILRAVAKGARFTRVPWVLVASTTVSVGLTLRTGVREVQVLGSLLAHRIEEATGRPADPDLVKKLTVELYLKPGRPPNLSDRRLRLRRLVRRWLFRGTFGRDTGKAATKALAAAEQIDVHPLVARWAELDVSRSPRSRQRQVDSPAN
jgi:hypothetical protein